MPEVVNNRFSFEYFKKLVEEELVKIETLDKIINEDLEDKDYVNAVGNIYAMDFGSTGGYDIILTDIPYTKDMENISWKLRSYEVILNEDIREEALITMHNEDSINKLVDNGAVIVDMIPYGRVSNKFGYILRNSIANEIPTLSTMDLSDERYNDWIVKATRKYPKELFESDKAILTRDLKSKIEYLKRWATISSTLTEERLEQEKQLIGYCDSLLEENLKERQK